MASKLLNWLHYSHGQVYLDQLLGRSSSRSTVHLDQLLGRSLSTPLIDAVTYSSDGNWLCLNSAVLRLSRQRFPGTHLFRALYPDVHVQALQPGPRKSRSYEKEGRKCHLTWGFELWTEKGGCLNGRSISVILERRVVTDVFKSREDALFPANIARAVARSHVRMAVFTPCLTEPSAPHRELTEAGLRSVSLRSTPITKPASLSLRRLQSQRIISLSTRPIFALQYSEDMMLVVASYLSNSTLS
jgi:hypothetical protein